jgi:hypothetical protein
MNLLLDSEFSLKIADFGHSCDYTGPKGRGFAGAAGTNSYMVCVHLMFTVVCSVQCYCMQCLHLVPTASDHLVVVVINTAVLVLPVTIIVAIAHWSGGERCC